MVVLLVVFIWMAGLVASVLPPAWNLERRAGLALLFQWQGVRAVPDNVVIVSIDRESALRLNQSENPVTWDRRIHALLVDILAGMGARVIAFDVLFGKRGFETCETSVQDRSFARSLSVAGNVLLFLDLDSEFKSLRGDREARVERETWPLACLVDAAVGVAPFALPKVPSRVDQFWLIKPGAGDRPTLPIVAALHQVSPYWADFCHLLEQSPVSANLAEYCPDQMPSGALLIESVRGLRHLLQNNPAIQSYLRIELEKKRGHKESHQALRILTRIMAGETDGFFNYYGPAQTISTLSYVQIIEMNAASLPNLEGKTVFIGASELRQSQRDDFQTVFRDNVRGYDLAGVEIVATAFANLMDGSGIRPLPWSLTVGLLLFSSIAMVLLFLRASPAAVVAGVLLLPVLLGGSAYLLFTHYFLWAGFVVPVLVQMPLALPVALFWRYNHARKEQAKVTVALRRLLPEDVVCSIVTGRDFSVEGKTLPGVCLFTDASQYTTLSEVTPPADLRAFLNQYYQVLFNPVEQRGGFISDVIGDAMMALWTSADPASANELRMREWACLAALDILDGVTCFNRNNPGSKLPTRIGLDFGEVSLGNVGAGGHYEFRAVGDTVNTASRIEGLNKLLGTWALASAETVAGVDSIVIRELGFFMLKGKKTETRIFELICHRTRAYDRTYQLVTAFEDALVLYRAKSWVAARREFDHILEDFPSDGPSAYYRDRCLQHMSSQQKFND